jgi:hypothetical protein
MTHRPHSFVLIGTLALGFGLATLMGVPPKNIIDNGSFERAVGERPEAWQLWAGADGRANVILSLDQGRAGGNALRLEYPAPAPRMDSPDPLAAPPVGFGQRGIALNVSDPYTLSFWMRGENIFGQSVRVALLDTSERKYVAMEKPLYATPEWRHYEFNFQWWLNKAPDTAELRFTLTEYGTLWVTGVAITSIPPISPHYTPRLPQTDGRNLVPNGSFEVGRDGWTTLGTKVNWGGNLSGLYGEISQDAPVNGANCMRVEVGPGKSPITYADCWPPARVVQNALLAANQGWIDVTVGQPYTLSAYMKASRAGVKGRLMIRQGGDPSKEGIQPIQKEFVLSEKWERYSLTVKAQATQLCVAVGPDITATPDAQAAVWLDAVQLEAGSEPTAFAPNEPLAIGFELAPRDHVFTPAETASVRVTAANAASEAKELLVRANIHDYFGRIVASPQLRLEVPAGSTVQRTWPLGRLDRGFFTVVIEWTTGLLQHQREIRLAVLDPYPWKDSIFGVNHAPVSAELGATLRRAGILWARDWSHNWGQLEPEPGHLSFAASDVQLDRLKQEGYKIICLMPPLPSTDWASTAPDSVPAELWYRMSYLPRDTRLLLSFIRRAVEHSRDRVHFWEFLNEPIWTGFCLPQPDFSKPGANYMPKDYVALLKQAYPVIKAADPEGRVIGGFAAQPWHYARDFMALGGLQSVDIFNIHNYGTSRAPEYFIGEMENLLKLMDEHGGRKPIWLTEYSYYGADQLPWEPWAPSSGTWAGNNLLRDERQCADWTVRYNVMLLAHGVEKIVYHSGSSGEPNDGLSFLECALLAEDGQPRKLYAAQATLAEMLGADCRFSRPLSVEEATGGYPARGIYGYAFQCGQRAVMPVWVTEAVAKSGSWHITIPAGVRARDLMGNLLPGGSAPLDTSPIFLESDTLPADRLAVACTLAGPVAPSAPRR